MWVKKVDGRDEKNQAKWQEWVNLIKNGWTAPWQRNGTHANWGYATGQEGQGTPNRAGQEGRWLPRSHYCSEG